MEQVNNKKNHEDIYTKLEYVLKKIESNCVCEELIFSFEIIANSL